MNTLQIKRALERNTFTKKTFAGVFAADEVPEIIDTLVVIDWHPGVIPISAPLPTGQVPRVTRVKEG